MKAFRKKNFLFDLDRTLIDSSPAHEAAFRGAMALHQPALAGGFEYELHKGRPTVDVFRELAGSRDDELITALVEAKQDLYRRAVDEGIVRLMGGASRLLELLRGAGKRLFVVTGSSRGSANRALSSAPAFSPFSKAFSPLTMFAPASPTQKS